MNIYDILKFCYDYPALVLAVVVGILLWSMVITVALTGGKNKGGKQQ